MATFPLLQEKFFGLDLKFGVYLYGALMTTMCIYYIFYPQMSFADWLVFVGVTCPAMALLIL